MNSFIVNLIHDVIEKMKSVNIEDIKIKGEQALTDSPNGLTLSQFIEFNKSISKEEYLNKNGYNLLENLLEKMEKEIVEFVVIIKEPSQNTQKLLFHQIQGMKTYELSILILLNDTKTIEKLAFINHFLKECRELQEALPNVEVYY